MGRDKVGRGEALGLGGGGWGGVCTGSDEVLPAVYQRGIQILHLRSVLLGGWLGEEGRGGNAPNVRGRGFMCWGRETPWV